MDIGELVVRHVDWIRRQARFYYTNEEDADDLASETIYKCLNQGRLFDPGRNFKPWIVAIMSNTYITQYNRRRCVMFTRKTMMITTYMPPVIEPTNGHLWRVLYL